MPVPITHCEHCKTRLTVPIVPGAPTSGYMAAGEITCGNCGKPTVVQPAFIIADPTVGPGEVSYQVPAVCPRCRHRFGIDMGPSRKAAEEGSPQPLDMKCPRCKTMAIVAHGGYMPIEGGVQFVPMEQQLYGKQFSPVEADRLIEFFTQALQNPRLTAQELRAELRKRPEPEIRSLADTVPETREELYGFIQALVALLLMFASAGKTLNDWRGKRLKETRARKNRQAAAERGRKAKAKRATEAKAAKKRATTKKALKTSAQPKSGPRKTWKDKKATRERG